MLFVVWITPALHREDAGELVVSHRKHIISTFLPVSRHKLFLELALPKRTINHLASTCYCSRIFSWHCWKAPRLRDVPRPSCRANCKVASACKASRATARKREPQRLMAGTGSAGTRQEPLAPSQSLAAAHKPLLPQILLAAPSRLFHRLSPHKRRSHSASTDTPHHSRTAAETPNRASWSAAARPSVSMHRPSKRKSIGPAPLYWNPYWDSGSLLIF